jgi:hypothetical protein
MTPIDIRNLCSDGMQPPKIIKKCGRPQVKRLRKNSWKRKQQKCSNCFELGHNKRCCTKQPGTKNGRGEWVKDWTDISPMSSIFSLPADLEIESSDSTNEDGRHSSSRSVGSDNRSSSKSSSGGDEEIKSSTSNRGSKGSTSREGSNDDGGSSKQEGRTRKGITKRVLPVRKRKRPGRYYEGG